ncbi:putative ABC transport system permease protein [Ectothiorhodospira magna]|uniref:Putative ABC transport system permease protein n=1 Tax=Ectothiorhodospira magna TaxID=867345 RepID=A0A1H9A8E2_9GAMM|nr:FtsX-like permease family protein [Ectothiorhodospira magna]SEP72929.1 putative ABC transport system permease protein [Ectothiorhodospira magna]
MNQVLRYSWLSLGREWRAGELRILAMALVIAVAAVTSVSFFTDRVQRGLSQQSTQLLGGDLSITSSAPLAPAVVQQAAHLELETARHVTFPSVVMTDEASQLTEIKAVSDRWPLRGSVRVSDVLFGEEREIHRVPDRGEVWAEPRLLQLLGLAVGDRLQVGDLEMTLTQVLTYEPDRGSDLFQLGPRVLISLEDLEATGLVVPGSRVSHRLLVAGSESQVAAFRNWAQENLTERERLEGVGDARPELQGAIARGEQFLGLAALVAVLLAGGAVAVAARHYSDRQSDVSAVMRCLGASRAFVLQVFILRILWLALLASAVGLVLGFLAQWFLAALLAQWFPGTLPLPSLWPAFTGLGVGVVTALGFGLPALLRIGQVPPLRVLRRDLGAPPPAMWLALVLALTALGGLLLWQAGDVRLAAWVLGGAGLTVVLLWGAAWALVQGLKPLRTRGGVALRFGLANLSRRGALSAVQLAAFGLGIMALLLLALVRVDLLSSWEGSLPPEAPNHFMINVQPDQVDPLQSLFEAEGLPAPVYYPMIRGRLVAVNDTPVDPETLTNPRAERLASREFNLSFARELQPDNQVVAGRWWSDDTDGQEFSIEEGLAQTLGLGLGDVLEFSISGERVTGQITSLRSVDWNSFNVNFFVLSPPGLLEDQPVTYVTSFHLAEGRADLLTAMVRQFPSITILDVRALMQQVRDIIDRASLAVEYVFLFTLAAGVTVLYAAIHATRDLRRRESAILRTLGAGRRQVLMGLLAEFTVMGALAGLLASAGASGIGWVLAHQVFDLSYAFNPWLWVLGIAGGALGVGLAGWLGTRAVLRQPPLLTLRQLP